MAGYRNLHTSGFFFFGNLLILFRNDIESAKFIVVSQASILQFEEKNEVFENLLFPVRPIDKTIYFYFEIVNRIGIIFH